jgi:hypothetical protein
MKRIPNNHGGMVRTLSELACIRGLLPSPWNFSCSGEPGNPTFAPEKIADCVNRNDINGLVSPSNENCSAYIERFITSTHKRRLDKKRSDWLARNAGTKRFPPSEKQKAIKSIQSTTMFDSMYRLREKSNYQDNDAFLWEMGRLDPATEFIEPVKVVFQSLMMNFEVLTIAAIGFEAFEDVVEQFVYWSGSEHARFLSSRMGNRAGQYSNQSLY